MNHVATVRSYLLALQQSIVSAFETEDGKPFLRDAWQRPAGGALEGDGLSQLVEQGHLLERGGCNFSHVRGKSLPPSATQHRPELAGAPFEALGVSLVMHPLNPYVPTVHMNVRMLTAVPAGGGAAVSWFGGGMDLTPYYGFEDDARHFHRTCAEALAPFSSDASDASDSSESGRSSEPGAAGGSGTSNASRAGSAAGTPGEGGALYPRFKRWCDEYFFLKHRNEPRGVGGIFFDDFADGGFARGFALIRATGDAFLRAYQPIVQRRHRTPYGERERDFQAYRRGRYVEFNLVWDRGTHFGLHGGGRTESILMSMPPIVKWRYDWKPEPGTPEARLYTDFLRPRDWLAADPVAQ